MESFGMNGRRQSAKNTKREVGFDLDFMAMSYGVVLFRPLTVEMPWIRP